MRTSIKVKTKAKTTESTVRDAVRKSKYMQPDSSLLESLQDKRNEESWNRVNEALVSYYCYLTMIGYYRCCLDPTDRLKLWSMRYALVFFPQENITWMTLENSSDRISRSQLNQKWSNKHGSWKFITQIIRPFWREYSKRIGNWIKKEHQHEQMQHNEHLNGTGDHRLL